MLQGCRRHWPDLSAEKSPTAHFGGIRFSVPQKLLRGTNHGLMRVIVIYSVSHINTCEYKQARYSEMESNLFSLSSLSFPLLASSHPHSPPTSWFFYISNSVDPSPAPRRIISRDFVRPPITLLVEYESSSCRLYTRSCVHGE
jgi:hypothetical protein